MKIEITATTAMLDFARIAVLQPEIYFFQNARFFSANYDGDLAF